MHIEGKLLKWGNSYGIRVRKADVDRLGVTPGSTLAVDIHPKGQGTVDDLPTWRLGATDDLDATAGTGFLDDL